MANGTSKASTGRAANFLFFGGAAILVAIVVAAVVLALVGDDDAGDPPGGDPLEGVTPVISTSSQNTVRVVDNDFEPRILQVPLGANVTWQFVGSLPHNVTDEDGSFESDTMDSGSYEMTFDAAGEYDYGCTVHPAMRGRLIVGEGATSTP